MDPTKLDGCFDFIIFPLHILPWIHQQKINVISEAQKLFCLLKDFKKKKEIKKLSPSIIKNVESCTLRPEIFD